MQSRHLSTSAALVGRNVSYAQFEANISADVESAELLSSGYFSVVLFLFVIRDACLIAWS